MWSEEGKRPCCLLLLMAEKLQEAVAPKRPLTHVYDTFTLFEMGLKNLTFAVCVRFRHIYPCSYHSSCLRSKRRTRGSCDGEIWSSLWI